MATTTITCTYPNGFKGLPLGPNGASIDLLPPNDFTDPATQARSPSYNLSPLIPVSFLPVGFIPAAAPGILLNSQAFNTGSFQVSVDSAAWATFKAAAANAWMVTTPGSGGFAPLVG